MWEKMLLPVSYIYLHFNVYVESGNEDSNAVTPAPALVYVVSLP